MTPQDQAGTTPEAETEAPSTPDTAAKPLLDFAQEMPMPIWVVLPFMLCSFGLEKLYPRLLALMMPITALTVTTLWFVRAEVRESPKFRKRLVLGGMAVALLTNLAAIIIKGGS